MGGWMDGWMDGWMGLYYVCVFLVMYYAWVFNWRFEQKTHCDILLLISSTGSYVIINFTHQQLKLYIHMCSVLHGGWKKSCTS